MINITAMKNIPVVANFFILSIALNNIVDNQILMPTKKQAENI